MLICFIKHTYILFDVLSLILEKPSAPVIKNNAKELENGKLTQVSHTLYTLPFKTQSFSCCCCCCLPYPAFAPVHKPASVLTMCRIKPCAFVFITQHASTVVSTLTHTCCYHSQRWLKDSTNDTDISECICRAYTPDLGSAWAIVTHDYTGNNHFYVV